MGDIRTSEQLKATAADCATRLLSAFLTLTLVWFGTGCASSKAHPSLAKRIEKLELQVVEMADIHELSHVSSPPPAFEQKPQWSGNELPHYSPVVRHEQEISRTYDFGSGEVWDAARRIASQSADWRIEATETGARLVMKMRTQPGDLQREASWIAIALLPDATRTQVRIASLNPETEESTRSALGDRVVVLNAISDILNPELRWRRLISASTISTDYDAADGVADDFRFIRRVLKKTWSQRILSFFAGEDQRPKRRHANRPPFSSANLPPLSQKLSGYWGTRFWAGLYLDEKIPTIDPTAAKKFAKSLGTIVDVPLMEVMISKTIRRLAGSAVMRRRFKRYIEFIRPAKIPVFVVSSPAENAWIRQNGAVITTGQLDALRNSDELAGVLAHEMSHLISGDYTATLGWETLTSHFLTGVTAATAIPAVLSVALLNGYRQPATSSQPGHGVHGAPWQSSTGTVPVGALTLPLFSIPPALSRLASGYFAKRGEERAARELESLSAGNFSVKQEMNADAHGTKLLEKAGYPPNSWLRVLKKQRHRDSASPGRQLAAH